LLQAYNIESTGKLRQDYYYSEYLLQGRLYSDIIVTTSLDKLIAYGLYKLYPLFAEVAQKRQLCLRVLQLRETFRDTPKELTNKDIIIAERIADSCFLYIDIRPEIIISLLSLQPQYRLEPRILGAFRQPLG
jgi:hypothetical protein